MNYNRFILLVSFQSDGHCFQCRCSRHSGRWNHHHSDHPGSHWSAHQRPVPHAGRGLDCVSKTHCVIQQYYVIRIIIFLFFIFYYVLIIVKTVIRVKPLKNIAKECFSMVLKLYFAQIYTCIHIEFHLFLPVSRENWKQVLLNPKCKFSHVCLISVCVTVCTLV